MGNKSFRVVSDFMHHKVDPAIRCPNCKHMRRVTGLEFLRMFDHNWGIGDAAKMLRCSECGHKGAEIAPLPPER
jgi:DNA-directed RNA polymerase subunit RPC12/RpoP